MVAASRCKVSATADWLAVGGVSANPSLRAEFPVEQGKYREISGIRADLRARTKGVKPFVDRV